VDAITPHMIDQAHDIDPTVPESGVYTPPTDNQVGIAAAVVAAATTVAVATTTITTSETKDVASVPSSSSSSSTSSSRGSTAPPASSLSHYERVIGQLDDAGITAFCARWRKNFVDKLQPKHLSPYWSVDHTR
jgi:hypothetical protein